MSTPKPLSREAAELRQRIEDNQYDHPDGHYRWSPAAHELLEGGHIQGERCIAIGPTDEHSGPDDEEMLVVELPEPP